MADTFSNSGLARKNPRRSDTGVKQKTSRGPDGEWRKIKVVDAASPSFANDLLYVFTKNVEKARRENKK